jgi:hypothetical protein
MPARPPGVLGRGSASVMRGKPAELKAAEQNCAQGSKNDEVGNRQ